MTSIIKLQAFSGVEGESPPCYMLQVDDFKFLLDCGWDESFNMAFVESLKKHVREIDAVLLSYPDPLHLGALPYMIGKCGLNCPVYATVPVYKMGQMFMYDQYQSHHNTEEFDLFTLDDVDAAFDKIQQLKYMQTVSLKGKGHGLQVTPLPAGHMIGGTMWKIVKEGEEEIIYMVDFNHKKERHLNGCMLDGIMRPHLLITDAYNADYSHARRRVRDEQLMTQIVQTMRADGNMLICVDTAGRVLELAQLLDTMWRTTESGLMTYTLALLNNVSYNVMEFAKSQVEWMSEKIIKAFEDQRNNPFQFKHLQLCHSLAELTRLPEPKVVLTSMPDLQCGFARELFIQWCGNPKNTIVLTNRTSPTTLARQLVENPKQQQVTLEVRRRVRLEGEELEDYKRIQKEKEKEEARLKAEKLQREEMDSSEESEDEEMVEFAGTGKIKHDLMMKSEAKSRPGFFKQTKKSYLMYPAKEEKLKWDDYGEIIRPEDYMIKEETQGTEQPMDTTEKPAEPEVEEVTEVPTKCISSLETFDIRASILYIDFEGRTDGESIRRILSQIKPRQLVLLRGNREAAENLANYCRNSKDIVQGKVFVPRLHEVVDATTESHIFQVKLLDSVVSALDFTKTRDAEIAWIDAQLMMNASKKLDLEGEEADGEVSEEPGEKEIVPTLLPLPAHQNLGHKSVFVNEPKLSEFKTLLLKEGVQAEFSGGILVCNNMVAIRRNEAGRMQVEGCLSDIYYKVRDLLYEQYAIV